MKVVLAGGFGKLGTDVLKSLVDHGHEVLAIDMITRDVEGYEGKYEKKVVDVTKPETISGLMNGADAVVSTVGLTRQATTLTNYDIDYQGNVNLLNEALKAGVKNFGYVSVLKADKAPDIAMLDAKAKMEAELKKSGIQYVIFRPTGYFYDIVKVFKPMVEKGKVTLLGKKENYCNVIDTPDLADFMVEHLKDENKTWDIGGTETYSYTEIANMMFEVNNKEPKISRAPKFLFDILAWRNRKNPGKQSLIKFSKWTLTEPMVADTKYGKHSFKEYIKENGKIEEA